MGRNNNDFHTARNPEAYHVSSSGEVERPVAEVERDKKRKLELKTKEIERLGKYSGN
jgi:hypothetical protein